MIRSMYAAVSGLRNHQTMMDVVGNNIANVNTTGFKSSNTVFQDVLSQTLRGAGRAGATAGGTNPAQIGLGASVAGVTTNFSQGAPQLTGRGTDLAITGDGFFIVEQGGERLFTRSGAFTLDTLGRLVSQNGGIVQGWPADATGQFNPNGPVRPLVIPVGDVIAPVQTTSTVLGGNLPADAAVGTTVATSIDVYDGQGRQTTVRFELTKTAGDTWGVGYRYVDAAGVQQPTPPAAATAVTGGPLTFDADGELTSGYTLTIPGGAIPGFGAGDDISVSLGAAAAPTRVTQFGSLSTASALDQDGSAAGSLQSFSIGQDGLVTGSYSNGLTRSLGQLALASFNNPEGLEKRGGSAFRATPASGAINIGQAGQGGRGLLSSGTLEMSNVDLSTEFTNLILAQRGFQANSRVVTTSDEMLQEVVNLKR
ncbi:flagellar basal-body rod protein FlgF [Dermatobacter hominis]|uniref:flagellar basal-body rod protein FlgF n=1 Tax=Dermatobacter hominis TaxID=2884263 RepID=UPI001D12AE9C|nr:flagellar basal-body rod protein FlgF [Dermatobacter hominis]UDY37187.1 flagellar basal-body rod protein FlgF [Dermatobacter hominis]